MNIGMFMRKAFSTGVTLVTSTVIVGSFSGCSAPAPVADTATSASTNSASDTSSVLSETSFGDIKNSSVSSKTVTTKTTTVTKTPAKKPIVVKKTIRSQTAATVVASNQNRFNDREEQWLNYQRKWEQDQQRHRNEVASRPQAQAQRAPRNYRVSRQQLAQARQVQTQNRTWDNQTQAAPRQQLIQIAMAPVIDPMRLSNAAISRTHTSVMYDGRYIPIRYPNGDVPSNIGVCSDVVIRAYRSLGIDLQRLVHEDMTYNFNVYPNLPKWGLSIPDTNIDHRRVHNLKAFLARYGQRLPTSRNPDDYQPGDVVTWSLGGDQEHIGIVVDRYSDQDPRRPLIVHHIDARGVKMEDMIFTLPITGHYRYLGGAGTTQLVSM